MLTDKTRTNGTFGPNCWAAALGDCSDKISREHIISRALFSQEVFVQGLAWCKSEPKKIGMAGSQEKSSVQNTMANYPKRIARRFPHLVSFARHLGYSRLADNADLLLGHGDCESSVSTRANSSAGF